MAFVCENTGSRKGYRESFWVVKKERWYTQSSLERFIREKYPAEFRHQWVSYKGDGYNIGGSRIVRAHGSPRMKLAIQTIDEYVGKVSDMKKKELYDCFSKGDYEATRAKMDEVWNVVLDETPPQQ